MTTNYSNQTLKKFAITNAIGLAIIGGLVFFVIIPSITKLETINISISEQLKQTEARKNARLQQTKGNIGINTIETSLNELSSGFISKAAEVDFIYSLENLANQFKLQNSLSIGEKKQMGNFQQSEIQISLQGRYIDQLKYINELKKQKYKISVNTIALAQGGAGGSETTNMTIGASVFWQ